MDLVEEIQRQNPQWRGQELAKETLERDIESKIREEIDQDIVTAVTGMRRVGKTTLLYRIIDELEEGETLYYSFDIEKTQVKNLLETYFEEILHKPPEKAEKVYIFLDEVQKVADWSDHVKAYHDSYENLKFFVTGSSSANIRKGGGESLVGRASLHHLTPFTFREFLRYREIEVPEKDFDDLKMPRNADRIRPAFQSYLETGGFPGLIELDENVRRERLQDIIDLTLFRDIVELFDIGRPELLEGIFRIISRQSGNVLNYNKIGRNLDAQYKTVKKYIDSLEKSFLVEISRRYENNVFKEYKKRPKIYVSDHSFCRLENTEKGLLAETVAFNHLKIKGEIGHWRANQEEIDIILKRDSGMKAFEIKYREDAEDQNINDFQSENPNTECYLITKKQYDPNKEVPEIPLWLLLTHI